MGGGKDMFPNDINLKGNVKEFEFTHYDVVVRHVNHYATWSHRTKDCHSKTKSPPKKKKENH